MFAFIFYSICPVSVYTESHDSLKRASISQQNRTIIWMSTTNGGMLFTRPLADKSYNWHLSRRAGRIIKRPKIPTLLRNKTPFHWLSPSQHLVSVSSISRDPSNCGPECASLTSHHYLLHNMRGQLFIWCLKWGEYCKSFRGYFSIWTDV